MKLMDGGEQKNVDSVRPNGDAADFSDIDQTNATKDEVLMSWSGKTFEAKEKNLKWYAIMGSSVVGAFVYLIITKDWFTAVILAVLVLVTFWYLRTVKPKDEDYKITPIGIWAGGILYPFSELHSYWIVYNQQVKKLYLAFTKKYLPSRVINLDKADPITLKNILTKYIPEQEKRGEDLIEKILRMIGI